MRESGIMKWGNLERKTGLLPALATVLLLLALTASVTRAAPPGQTPPGVIAGQVKNATTGQPVGDVEVKLRRWQGDTELTPLTTQAAADGRFRFEGLDTQSQVFYRAEVVYNGIPFPTQFVSFEPGATQLSLPVSVYETTASDAAITVERFHFIIIMNDQPGSISILELYQFSNHGDRAYVGSVDQDGLRETVRIALPAGAQNLSLQGGTLGVDFLETGGGLVATSPVVPGQETFNAAFLYVVPYSGRTLSLDRPLNYNTTALNGLLLDVGATLESKVLTFTSRRTMQGQTFLQYTGQNLKAGETLPIRLNDLDKVMFAGAAGGAGSPSAELRQTMLLWLVLILGGMAVALGLAYPALRSRLRRETSASENGLTRDRQRLLLTLARLDQAYQAGQLKEIVYRRVRARRKGELVEVLRRMREEGL